MVDPPTKTTHPSVSVLLPVYNGEDHIDAALESVMSQTLRDFEVVVVDDGSTDGTSEILRGWATRDSRVCVMRQAHSGIVGALERARVAAQGEYLARMDADDIAEPRRLELQRTFMETHAHLAGCGCLVEYFPSERVRDGARRYQAWINGIVTPAQISAGMFVECPIAHPTFFLRAGAVDAVGGYDDRGWPEDYDLVLRLWAAGLFLGKVPEVLLRWRERPYRLSRTHARYAQEAFLACKVHYLRETLLRDGRAVVIWGAGPVGKGFARRLLAAGTRVTAFAELNPRQIGQEIHGAPVLDASEAVDARGPLHLAAVGQAGARDRIVAFLRAARMVEMDDFVAVA